MVRQIIIIENMKELLTPEIMAIVVVAVLILVAVFFSVVANKIAGIDGKVTELTENIYNRIDTNLQGLGDRLHSDVEDRSKQLEESLNQMGDSWRNTLDKTVTDVQSEIGKLKGEVNESSSSLRNSLMEVITDNSVNFNEQLAQVRDTHAKSMDDYHQQLADQVRQHAKGENEMLTQALNGITSAVTTNLTGLAKNQSQMLNNLSTSIGDGYKTLADKVVKDLSTTTEKADSKLTTMTSQINKNVVTVSEKINQDLNTISNRVTDDLGNVIKNVDTSLASVSSNLTKNVGSLADRLNHDMEAVTKRLDKSVTQVTTKVDTNMASVQDNVLKNLTSIGTQFDAKVTDVSSGVQTKLGNISKNLEKGIDQLGKKVDQDIQAIGTKVDNRINDDMQDLIKVFQNFADKVKAIEQTREQILELASNVNVLAQVLDDRRARGNIGEVLVESIVSDTMAPSDYALNATLSNGYKVDCLLKLPKPSGAVAISTKMDLSDLEVITSPLASETDRKNARLNFRTKLQDAIKETSTNCVIRGETAEGAVLMLSSESAFSEAHVHHRMLVDEAYKSQVWLASPSTLIAMITVARAVIKDASARRQMDKAHSLLKDIQMDYDKLEDNFKSMTHDVNELLTTAANTRKAAHNIGLRFHEAHTIFSYPTDQKLPDHSDKVANT